MNIPLINSLNVNDINTSLIAIRKNMQKTSSGTEKLQDVDVNVNIAHNSLYCAADSTVIKGATLFQGCSIKVLFTSAITGSDSSTPLVINYNDVNISVKTGKNGTLADFVAYNIGSSFVYCQAYTTLELLFDGNDFIIMGNPVVISNSDYTVYTDGSKTYTSTKIENKLEWVLLANLNLNERVQIPPCKEFLLRHEDNSLNTYTEIIPYDTLSGFYAIGGDDGNGLVPYAQLYSDYKLEFKRGSNHVLSVFVRY